MSSYIPEDNNNSINKSGKPSVSKRLAALLYRHHDHLSVEGLGMFCVCSRIRSLHRGRYEEIGTAAPKSRQCRPSFHW